MITEQVIRELVLPEIARSGGATLSVPTIGNMPPYLVKADKFQPPTWVVGTVPGGTIPPRGVNDPHWILRAINGPHWGILAHTVPGAHTAIGFWLEDGYLHIDGVEFYTLHSMAIRSARRHNQIAIYAMHTGETEYLTYPAPVAA